MQKKPFKTVYFSSLYDTRILRILMLICPTYKETIELNTITTKQLNNTMKYFHDGLIYSYVLLVLHLSC